MWEGVAALEGLCVALRGLPLSPRAPGGVKAESTDDVFVNASTERTSEQWILIVSLWKGVINFPLSWAC